MFSKKSSEQNRRLVVLRALVAASTVLFGSLVATPESRAQGPSEAETVKFIEDHATNRAFLSISYTYGTDNRYHETIECKIYAIGATTENINLTTELCDRQRWEVQMNLHDIEKVEYIVTDNTDNRYHGVRFYCKGGSRCIVDEKDLKVWDRDQYRTLLFTGASDAERVARAFQHLLKLSSEKDQGLFSSNEPVRKKGRLGLIIQPVTDELAQERKLGIARGALVVNVPENGPAQAARIQAGDVILDYDGKQFADQPELISMISDTPVGKKVSLGIWRNGGKLRLDAVIGESSN
jgi:PDZ domain